MHSPLASVNGLTAPGDPERPDWRSLALPDTWVDRLRWWQLGGVLALLRVLLVPRRRPVDVPAGVPMAEHLPAYLKQEFHAIPNGNYSNRLVGPYVEGFDASMLGRMHAVREWVARRLAGAQSVLEVGCGGGKLASVIQRSGAPDVWGIDASPYMLRYGAQLNPHVKFVQGLAEDLPFSEERFDAVAVCFMFHELPAESADRAISEIWRVLKPGAKLVVVEPGPEQLSTVNPFKLWKLAGLPGVYFGILARFVFEPFVKEWHARDHRRWLNEHGFKVLDECGPFPLRVHVAERLATARLEKSASNG